MLHKAKRMPIFAALVTVIFWGSAFPAVRFSLQYYSPESIMLFRFLVASAVLSIYCFLKNTGLPEKKDLPWFAAAGFIGIFAYMWLFNTGTSMVTSGVSSFIIASAPIFTLLLSAVFLKEKADVTSWAGVLISFFGLLIIAYSQNAGLEFNWGTVLLILAAISTSIYNILQRKLLRTYSPIQTTAFSIVLGTIPMSLFFPALVKEFAKAPLSADLVIVFLGVFPAALAYFTWGYALSKAEKTVYVTSCLYLVPFTATIMAYFWLHETVGLLTLAGGLVIILGMAVINLRK